jgi:hypothetical protein
LNWRQRYLRGDATGLNDDLRTMMEHMMPQGMEVKVGSIENLEDYEKPLTVAYNVKGTVASLTGKRLILPGDIFETNAKPTFPHEKREESIFFDYPHVVQDTVHVNFPASFAVETLPAGEQLPLQNFAVYMLKAENATTSYTVRREFDIGKIFFNPEDYPDLRAFYNKFETKDQEPVVLKAAPPVAGGS